jgi:hypothetical protein
MSRRVRLGALLTILVALVVVSLLLDWPDWLGRPSAEDLIGKWLPEDPKSATISFYRSGECELSWPNGEDGASGPETASGVWKLNARRLAVNVDSGSSPSFDPFMLVWHIRIRGNELTYQTTSDKPKTIKFRRAPPEPGKSFDTLNTADFVGSSKGLRQTVVVPTLETPVPAGKSAVWCATPALAWQELEKEVGGGPVVLQGAADLSRALGTLPDVGLLPEHHYVAAGLVLDGVVNRIGREMAARFPGVTVPPDLATRDPLHVLSYAYLQAAVPYEFAFKDSDKPLQFTDSQGRRTPVKAFGIRPKDEHEGKDSFRSQVGVLFREGKDFAIDLSKGTQPYQVVLARMERKAALGDTLADLQERIARAARKGRVPELSEAAVLLVPNMDWRIEHRFEEMHGKPILHPALPPKSILELTYLLMQFKMDRRGAVFVSQADMRGLLVDGAVEAADPQDYRLDRPYLILLRKRGLRVPFFMMWVDNPELLQPR